MLSWCQGKKDQGTSGTSQLAHIPVPLLSGLLSFSTALQQTLQPAAMLLIFTGKWSNIKEIPPNMYTHDRKISFLLHVSMLIYQCPHKSGFPKFMPKTPSSVPLSAHPWTRNNEKQKTPYMLQGGKREKNLYLRNNFFCVHWDDPIWRQIIRMLELRNPLLQMKKEDFHGLINRMLEAND